MKALPPGRVHPRTASCLAFDQRLRPWQFCYRRQMPGSPAPNPVLAHAGRVDSIAMCRRVGLRLNGSDFHRLPCTKPMPTLS